MMKNLLKLILCALIIIGLFGCGESKPKCEHANTTTKYEISGLSIKKSVTCNDCEKEVSKGTVSNCSMFTIRYLLMKAESRLHYLMLKSMDGLQ